MFGSCYGDGIFLFEFFVCCYFDLCVMVFIMFEMCVLMSNILCVGIKVIVSKFDELQYIFEGMYVVVGGCIYFLLMFNVKLFCWNGELQVVYDDFVVKLGKWELEVLCMYVIGKMVSEIVLQFNCSVKIISLQKQMVMCKFEFGIEVVLFDFVVCYGLFGSSEV